MTFQLTMSNRVDDVLHMTSNHTAHWVEKRSLNWYIFIGQKNAHWVEDLLSGSHLVSGRVEQHRSNLSAGADVYDGLQKLSYILYFYNYNSCYANIRSFILVAIAHKN
jgi:hypothetical protein